MSAKKKLRALDLETRLKVIEDSSNGLSQRKLAEKYECGKTQILNILKEKEALEQRGIRNINKNVKKETFQPFKEVNDLTLAWFEGARVRNVPISRAILQAKAKTFAQALNIEHFLASSGWLEKFCHRNNIVFNDMFGERASVAENDLEEWVKWLPVLIKDYDFKDIYNVHETGLFYRTLPSKSFTYKGGDAHGSKKIKERITVMLCVNALGEKEQLLIINSSLRPSCFKNVSMAKLDVNWHANKKARMTTNIFTEWIQKFNSKMKQQKRKVLLILDIATCHPQDLTLSNIELLFLPANTSSKLQPLDLGIIRSFKLHYMRRIMTTLVVLLDSGANLDKLIKKISIAEAVEYVKEAWSGVSKDTIKNCFQKSGIISEPVANKTITKTENEITQTEKEVIDLGKRIGIEIDVNFTEDDEVRNEDDWEKEILEFHIDQGSASAEDNENRSEEEEEKEEDAPTILVSEGLDYVGKLKHLGRHLGDNNMVDLLHQVQTILEKEEIRKKTVC